MWISKISRSPKFLQLPQSLRVSQAFDFSKELRESGKTNEAKVIEEYAVEAAKLQKMKIRRSQLMALPTQSGSEAGAELGSIIFCAASACLCASLHPIFLLFFGAGFLMYRKSTRAIRLRRSAQTEIQSLNLEISNLSKSLTFLERRISET